MRGSETHILTGEDADAIGKEPETPLRAAANLDHACAARDCNLLEQPPRLVGKLARLLLARSALANGEFALGDLESLPYGDDAFEFFLAAAGNHHRPAVGRQKFRPGLADSAATTGHPGHAFPVI